MPTTVFPAVAVEARLHAKRVVNEVMGDAVGYHLEEAGLAHKAGGAFDVEMLVEDIVEASILVLCVNLLLPHGYQDGNALQDFGITGCKALKVVLDVLRADKRVQDVEFDANLAHILPDLVEVDVVAIVGNTGPELRKPLLKVSSHEVLLPRIGWLSSSEASLRQGEQNPRLNRYQ